MYFLNTHATSAAVFFRSTFCIILDFLVFVGGTYEFVLYDQCNVTLSENFMASKDDFYFLRLALRLQQKPSPAMYVFLHFSFAIKCEQLLAVVGKSSPIFRSSVITNCVAVTTRLYTLFNIPSSTNTRGQLQRETICSSRNGRNNGRGRGEIKHTRLVD